jgi:ubiquinone biosynthesis protein
MSLVSIPQRVRGLQRLPQILRVLIKYGFDDVVSRIGLAGALTELKQWALPSRDTSTDALTTEQRLRLTLEELGPTFVKLGQVMATRPDLIPMSFINELRKLQDKVKPFDTEGMIKHVEAEYGRPLSEMFAEFDPKPLAAASIAQVHRAVLKDGRKVVLKVQRPNLERIIETDLALLGWLAALAEERLPELRRYRPVSIVAEFQKSIIKEIDFQTEAYHIKRFAKNFAGDPAVYVPQVFDDLTTTRILCEEFIDGVKLNDPSLHTRADVDLPALAKTGIRVILEQALVHGFFHADPHPGNLFWLPGNRICCIDYGMMGSLDQERIDELLAYLVGILTRDLDKIIRLFSKLGLIGDEVDVRALRRDIDELIARFESVELAKLDIGRYIQAVFEVIVRHDVHLPSDLLLVGKALATIEGVGRDIYPDLNTLEEIRPIILRIYLARLADPAFHGRAAKRVLDEALYLVETAPRDVRIALRKLRQGDLTFKVELPGLEALARSHAQAQNRLVLGIVTSALLLAASYLVVNTPALSHAILPLGVFLAILALLLAALYGVVLLVGFFRSGGV